MTTKSNVDLNSDELNYITKTIDQTPLSNIKFAKSGDVGDASELPAPASTSPGSIVQYQSKVPSKQPDFIKLTSGNVPKNIMRVKMLPSSLKITQLNQKKVNSTGDNKLQIVQLTQKLGETTILKSSPPGTTTTATIVSTSSVTHFTTAQKSLHLTKVSHLNLPKNIIVSSITSADATSTPTASSSKSVIINSGLDTSAGVDGTKKLIPIRNLSNDLKFLGLSGWNKIQATKPSSIVLPASGVTTSSSQLLKSNNLKIIKTLPMSTTVTSSSISATSSPHSPPAITSSPETNTTTSILKSIFEKAVSTNIPTVINSPPSTSVSDIQEKMLNIQISNGVLSDPHGAIKLLKSDSATIEVNTDKLSKLLEPTTPEKEPTPKTIAKKKTHLLEASPRLRSKSLTLNHDDGKNVAESRRLSLSSCTTPAASLTNNKLVRKILQASHDNLHKTNEEPASLLCNEQLDTISTNSSSNKLESSASGNLSLSSSIEEKPSEDIPIEEIHEDDESAENLNDEEDESTSSSSLIMALCGSNNTSESKNSENEIKKKILLNLNKSFTSDYISRISRKYLLSKGKDGFQRSLEEDPFDCIEWDDGIGSLQNSNLHFTFNEFGIVEIVDNNEFEDIKKQQNIQLNIRPLNERIVNEKNRKQTIIEKNEPLYTCQKCLSVGLAKEFYTPESCCLNCFNEHKMERLKEAVTKQSNSFSTSPIKSPDSDKDTVDRKKEKNSTENNSNGTISDDEYDRNLCSSKVNIPVPLPNEFSWDRYLIKCPGNPVSKRCFTNAFPSSHLPNRFVVGHKLEAIDPENSSVISVCSVVDKQGYRIKIAFDGYPRLYDFWTNADSLDLLPCGFCHSTGRRLRVPPLFNEEMFNWDAYLSDTGGTAAPKYCFQYSFMSTFENPFKVGMKLEADDLKNSEKVCVATVRDVIRTRILVHFDGWDDIYDYWASVTSPYIHPVDWHKENGFILTLPPGKANFTWKKYLEETTSFAAPRHYFSGRKPIGFVIGMKLEAVDKRVPALLRPATVVAIDDYEVKIQFDGWPLHCSYWLKDESPDLHPIKWGSRTGHIVEFPPDFGPRFKNSCGIKGCRGIGNATDYEKPYHYSTDECPYEKKNYFKTRKTINRLEYRNKEWDRYFYTFKTMKRPYASGTSSGGSNSYSNPNIERNPQKKPRISAKDIEELQNPEIVAPSSKRSTSPKTTNSTAKSARSTLKQKVMNELQKRVNTSKNLLIDYGPRLHQVHQMWQRNTKIVTRQIPSSFNTSNPLTWDTETVSKYICALPNCTNLGVLFKEHEIDGVALLSLNQKDLLKHMKLKLGPTIVIYNQIVHLREECAVKFLP